VEEPSLGRPSAAREPAARAGVRRLLGFDRSQEPARQTAAERPWRPWTIPNAITFARLALIPVFLVVGLTSDHGQSALTAALFALIGWGDFADGAMARLTGQYSRLGALVDPATDRLLAVSGAAVCWRWDLLPHWALAVLIARELFMLVLGRYALGHGLNIGISRMGRTAIVPVMAALFFAMVGLQTLGEVLLYIGIVLALLASAGYVRTGADQLRARREGGTQAPAA
jgi:cardiolipin synthase